MERHKEVRCSPRGEEVKEKSDSERFMVWKEIEYSVQMARARKMWSGVIDCC